MPYYHPKRQDALMKTHEFVENQILRETVGKSNDPFPIVYWRRFNKAVPLIAIAIVISGEMLIPGSWPVIGLFAGGVVINAFIDAL